MFKNPMLDLVGLGFGLDILKGSQKPEFEGQLSGSAASLAAQASQLGSYELSGTLPPGIQATLNTAGASAAASIRSQYASRGMTGSSAEAQDLQNLALQIQGQGQTIAAQLFSQGLQETGMADQLYQGLMQTQIAQDQELSQGVTGLAAALANFSRPVQYVQATGG